MLRKQLQRSLLLHVITYLSSKCVKSVGKMKKTDFFPKTRIQKFLDKSPWDSHCNIHMFLSFLVSLLKRCILFENFSQFSLPSPYTKSKLEKKFWIYASNSVCGEGGGSDLCGLDNAPEKQKCPKTFVHDCRQAKMLMTIGQHIKTFSSPKLMIAFQITGKRSDLQHHG